MKSLKATITESFNWIPCPTDRRSSAGSRNFRIWVQKMKEMAIQGDPKLYLPLPDMPSVVKKVSEANI